MLWRGGLRICAPGFAGAACVRSGAEGDEQLNGGVQEYVHGLQPRVVDVPDVELPDVEGLSGGLRDQLRSTDYDDAIAAVDEVLRAQSWPSRARPRD